jgi:predicted secreted protein
MNIATIILVYVVIWWMVFFAALPIGVRAQNETEEGVIEGTVPSAPSNPNLLKKALYTSLIAAILTTGYYFLADSEIISFRASR